MNLKTILKNKISEWIRLAPKYNSVHFLGRDLFCAQGTIQLNPDKDDAWYFELCKHHNNIFELCANLGFTGICAALSGKKRFFMISCG